METKNKMKSISLREKILNKKGGILSIYTTAGYPLLDSTLKICKALEKANIDFIEIGIPFSDPLADGPTIQSSNKKALENRINLSLILEQVSEIKKHIKTPLVLMGYLNVFLKYGIENLIKKSRSIGISHFIIPDLPIEEFEVKYKKIFYENRINCIFLITPETSIDRIRHIDTLSNGFIYCVSSVATTGGGEIPIKRLIPFLDQVRSLKLYNPIVVGFGIRTKEDYQLITKHAAGVIIGSAFIELIADNRFSEVDVISYINSINGD